MCSIAGFFSRDMDNFHDRKDIIKNMNRLMAHRGPDDTGICAILSESDESGERYTINNENESMQSAIGYLGFNRLSIRDLSKNGHQPMLSTDGKVVILFNGEIYNTEELKKNYLVDTCFRSTTDTEVVLELYLKLGIEHCLKLLDGMFALCIVDIIQGKIILARDRVGIKPLYIYNENGNLVFASELKAILSAGIEKPEVDETAFYELMMFGFNYKRTLVKNIYEFEAGCYLELGLGDDSKGKTTRYWSPEDAASIKNGGSYRANKKKLRKTLEESVYHQMISDVKIGCQLSGGVDSSLIAYYFLRGKNKVSNIEQIQNKSFGIIPENKSQSEEKYMTEVSRRTGIDVDKIKVKNSWVYDNWKKAIWYLDGIPSFVNEMGIMALARETHKAGVTVLMSGEGADEVLGGYRHIADAEKVLKLSRIYSILPSKKSVFLKKHHLEDDNYKGNISEEYYLLYASDGNANNYLRKICPDFESYREKAIRNRIEVINRINSNQLDLFTKCRCYDLAVRVTALCNRQDKMTMAASIENRVPFLSNNFIDVGLSIPKKYLSVVMRKPKPRYGINPFMNQGKYLLKDICADVYGKEFAYRHKQGFPLPLEDYLKKLIESPEFDKVLKKLEMRQYVDIDVVKEYCKRIENNSEYYSWEAKILWRLFSFEFFCELFIDSVAK